MEGQTKKRNFYTKNQRIKTSSDFAAFKNQNSTNQKLVNPYFQITIQDNQFDFSRMAVIVPKRIVKKSPDRNLIKRIARETFRKLDLAKMDYLIIARKFILKADNKEISNGLKKSLIEISQKYQYK